MKKKSKADKSHKNWVYLDAKNGCRLLLASKILKKSPSKLLGDTIDTLYKYIKENPNSKLKGLPSRRLDGEKFDNE